MNVLVSSGAAAAPALDAATAVDIGADRGSATLRSTPSASPPTSCFTTIAGARGDGAERACRSRADSSWRCFSFAGASRGRGL
ncbi:MAG: hypothetical protein ACJ79E_21460 [Anaeromyxobacteraceae bacterium]